MADSPASIRHWKHVKAIHSSRTSEWSTPQPLFSALNSEFHFRLDAAANSRNAKCKKWFGKREDGLEQPWAPHRSVFVNPPYGRELGLWVYKAMLESRQGCTVVMLIPARTDTLWFHNLILPNAEVRFLKGRISFRGKSNADRAPFPSMLVIFRPNSGTTPQALRGQTEKSEDHA